MESIGKAIGSPLKIKFALEGGYSMDYRIAQKDAFRGGLQRVFRYETAQEDIPKL